MRSITVLGASGTIGQNTLDLLRLHKDTYKVKALSAGKNLEQLVRDAKEFAPEFVAIEDETQYEALKEALSGTAIKCGAGASAIIEAATINSDLTMAGISGMAGLEPLMAAIKNGGTICIANKEPLVAAGALVLAEAKKYGTTLLPTDSEHNAVFQVWEGANCSQIDKVILTASGGPFREWSYEQMRTATPHQAVAHPNWKMGRKISVDSATLMNKGLELIEAKILFGLLAEQIDTVIHPQSVVHALVGYTDGSWLAQMGAADMRTPIAHCLAWPERIATSGQKLDPLALSRLDFQAPDEERFPALKLARACLRGEADSLVLNAANEILVDYFLNEHICFTDIAVICEEMLSQIKPTALHTLEDVLSFDQYVRAHTKAYILGHTGVFNG